MNTLIPLILFVTTLLAAALAMAVYSYRRYGEIRYWRDWRTAIAAVIIIAGVLVFLSNKVHAEPFAYTQVYFGLEYPISNNYYHPACEPGDDQTTSNVGFDQNLWHYQVKYITFDTNATYRHHSCTVNADRYVSDTFGVNAVLRIDW